MTYKITDDERRLRKASERLTKVIKENFLGVRPKDWEVELDDDDWLLILHTFRERDEARDAHTISMGNLTKAHAAVHEWKKRVAVLDAMLRELKAATGHDDGLIAIRHLVLRATQAENYITATEPNQSVRDNYVCGEAYEMGRWSRRNIKAFFEDQDAALSTKLQEPVGWMVQGNATSKFFHSEDDAKRYVELHSSFEIYPLYTLALAHQPVTAGLEKALETINAMPRYPQSLSDEQVSSLHRRYHKALDLAEAALKSEGRK